MTKFKFKKFQTEDLARLALHDGAILAWDKGCGKGLAMFAWALLKVGFAPASPLSPREPCLVVAPGDAHDQVKDDAREKLGVHTTPLMSQDDFLRLSTLNSNTSQRELPAGFYLTTYTALASNGMASFPDPADHSPAAMMQFLNLGQADLDEFYDARGNLYSDQYNILELTHDTTARELEASHHSLGRHAAEWRKRELDLAHEILRHFHPRDDRWIANQVITRTVAEYSKNIGESRLLKQAEEHGGKGEKEQDNSASAPPPLCPSAPLPASAGIKCVFSPSLADLCSETFAAVAIDEGVRMKGEDTIIGQGLRQMNPRYRLVLTGTPIKNRLPDIFRLAHWATGGHEEPTARWPYASATSEREAFAEEFLLSERNLSKEKKSETKRRYVKLSPQVCQIHKLWKLFGPIIVRRLKKDIGEQLVRKSRHVIRVPMGTRQAEVYRYHLEGEYLDCNGRKAVGAQLQALRVAASAPHSQLLQPVPHHG